MPTASIARPTHRGQAPKISFDVELAVLQRAEARPASRRMTKTQPPLGKLGRKAASLPICTATSFEQPGTRQALNIWHIKYNISDAIIHPSDRLAFLKALNMPALSDSERVAYGTQAAELVGLPIPLVTSQQITVDPVRLYARTLAALQAYASSHRWTLGLSPQRPLAADLGLEGAFAEKLSATLDYIQTYRTVQFQRNKTIAIGGAIILSGVAIGFASFYFTQQALGQGRIKAEGYAWDQTLGRYIKTKHAEWYKTPAYYITDEYGFSEPVYPATPESIAANRELIGTLIGLGIAVFGYRKISAARVKARRELNYLQLRGPSDQVLQLIHS